MAGVPVTLVGYAFRSDVGVTPYSMVPITIIADATYTGLGLGGGPIIPPAQPGPPGSPTFPIWGPPGFNPPGPGYPPGIGGGPIIPPTPPPGVPAHPIYWPPGSQIPSHPINLPGFPTHPWVPPPGMPAFPIWGPPGIELPPVPGYPPVIGGGPIMPPEGGTPPSPGAPEGDWEWAYVPGYGWVAAWVPGDKPQPPPVGP